MPIPEPKFDSRTYRELLNEAIARIPSHNPEWTNFNHADPGITLLQLFAFMAESIIYRANLIPERNRRKFLRLLGIPMRPAETAKGIVTFQNPRGDFRVFTLDKDVELLAGNVPFRTEIGLQVLPIEARLYYKKPIPENRRAEVEDIYKKLYATLEQPGTNLEFYETTVYEPTTTGVNVSVLDVSRQTEDGSLWIALLARKTEADKIDQVRNLIANQILSLGIIPALDEEGSVLFPQGPPRSAEKSSLIFEMPNASDERIRYEPLNVSLEVDPLARPSIVKIKLPSANKLNTWTEEPYMAGVGNRPPSLQETDDLDRLITWIRIRSPQVDISKEASSRQLSINLSWTGINAASVIQRTHVNAERLPGGAGEPDQVVTLTNSPVIKDSLELMINGEVWKEIDDILTAQPEVPVRSPRFSAKEPQPSTTERKNDLSKVYTLDLESGEIRFGDGAHGMRPPLGATIQATYSYGGGRQGVVAIGSIKKGPTLPAGLKVHNPVPTWGGSNGETVPEAEKNIPKFIKHRDRLVSDKDFRDITLRTPGVEIGRVEILPLFHPKLPNQDSEGVVTVLVIPRTDPVQPNAPQPDRLFLETVCTHLGPRRILTTEVHVRGPQYVPIWISVSIDVVPGHDEETVREKVKKEVERFLSPLEGGFEGKGWTLSKNVDKLEVSAAVTRVDGVAKVNQIRICEDDGVERPEIVIEGLELPQLMKIVVVTDGDAPELDEVRGEAEPPPVDVDGVGTIVPVPVIPPECGIS